jgi:tRNA (guanine37-N1)-methyltransferase
LILLCGRYGGVDQRFIDQYIDECISFGRFVLNGGELPALSYLESILRVLPKTLGNQNSALNDSFSSGLSGGLEAPSYSRPSEWEEAPVPEFLVSGDHKRIEDSKLDLSKKMTLKWYEVEIETLKAELSEVLNSVENKSADKGNV